MVWDVTAPAVRSKTLPHAHRDWVTGCVWTPDCVVGLLFLSFFLFIFCLCHKAVVLKVGSVVHSQEIKIIIYTKLWCYIKMGDGGMSRPTKQASFVLYYNHSYCRNVERKIQIVAFAWSLSGLWVVLWKFSPLFSVIGAKMSHTWLHIALLPHSTTRSNSTGQLRKGNRWHHKISCKNSLVVCTVFMIVKLFMVQSFNLKIKNKET